MTITIHTSKATDGSMKGLDESERTTAEQNRTRFLQGHDIKPENATLVYPTYDENSYCRYATLSDTGRGEGIIQPPTTKSDALVVTKPGHALLLALADCIGAVIHDPVKNIIMLSHLGRQSLEQNGGEKSIAYLQKNHGCEPQNLQVWLSPAAGKGNYPLYAFDNRSLHEVAIEQLLAGGVLRRHIEASPIDTTTDLDYFSHSEFQRGNRETDGRFAVVAIINTLR